MSAEAHDPRTGQHLRFLETGATTNGRLLSAELRLAPSGWVPRHAHLRIDERLEAVSGDVVFRVGRDEHRLRPGDAVDVPRRKAHTLRNVGETEAVLRLEARPARRTQGLMRAVFAVSRGLGALRPRRRPAG